MAYTIEEFNGKQYKIPENDLANLMKSLQLNYSQAVEMWVEENTDDYISEEFAEALEKTKNIKIDHGTGSSLKGRKSTKKNAPEKIELFNKLYEWASNQEDFENLEIETKEKKMGFNFKGLSFSIDLIKHNKK